MNQFTTDHTLSDPTTTSKNPRSIPLEAQRPPSCHSKKGSNKIHSSDGFAGLGMESALSLTVYVAFMFLHSGLLLTSAALITGHNLNYSLWPPPKLPVALVEALGGKGYRLSIGCCLSFVIGPLMRHAVVPAVTAAWGALWWLRS